MKTGKAQLISNKSDWQTPRELFDRLDNEFHFTLDPCSSHENALCKKHYTIAEDGLAQDWTGEVVFCNPPYGKEPLPKGIEKCATEKATCVMLIPARVSRICFHRWIFGNPNAETRFIKGRLRFSNAKHNAPFDSVVVIFRNDA